MNLSDLWGLDNEFVYMIFWVHVFNVCVQTARVYMMHLSIAGVLKWLTLDSKEQSALLSILPDGP